MTGNTTIPTPDAAMLERKLRRLRRQDLSDMGYEARQMFQQRLDALESLYRDAMQRESGMPAGSPDAGDAGGPLAPDNPACV